MEYWHIDFCKKLFSKNLKLFIMQMFPTLVCFIISEIMPLFEFLIQVY